MLSYIQFYVLWVPRPITYRPYDGLIPSVWYHIIVIIDHIFIYALM